MAFADSTEAQNETEAALRRSGLIGMRDDTRIEECRGPKHICVEKISANELPLGLGERDMVGQRLFHLRGARLEGLQQIAMTAEEVLQYIGQFTVCCLGIEREHTFDDMVGTGLVGRIEITRLRGRLERPNDHAGRIRPQMKGLAIKEREFRQNGL